jgi:hypothetical protein
MGLHFRLQSFRYSYSVQRLTLWFGFVRCSRQKSSWAAKHAKNLGAASALSDNLFRQPASNGEVPSSPRSSHGDLYTIDPATGLLEVADEVGIDYPVSTQSPINLDRIFREAGTCASPCESPGSIPPSIT